MRRLSLMFPASLLLLTTAASAQTPPYPLTVPDAMSHVQVTAPVKPFVFYDHEAEAVQGAYAMSNGWRLDVTPAPDGIDARIDRRHSVHLVAVSPDEYVSRDGNVLMSFNRALSGSDMSMSYVPASGSAQAVVVTATTRLARR
jgi:hypothetical protein